jgi:hypothetical protein
MCTGARGGRAEFSWDNVKSDKDREFYLGHSVKATTGRWQKGALLNSQLLGLDRTCAAQHSRMQRQQQHAHQQQHGQRVNSFVFQLAILP